MKRFYVLCAVLLCGAAHAQQVGSGTEIVTRFSKVPTGCTSGNFANSIDNSGNLTCSAGGAPNYFMIGGATHIGRGADFWMCVFGKSDTGVECRTPIAVAGTITEFYVTTNASGSGSWIASLRKNGVSVASCSFSGINCSSTGLSIAIAAGDTLGVFFDAISGPVNSSGNGWSVKFVPS